MRNNVYLKTIISLSVFCLILSFGFYANREENIVIQANEVPLGTIISSFLQYDDFMKLNGQVVTPFNSKKSIWAPCDGRDLSGSKFAIATNISPDLRGVFLRCVNSIYEDGKAGQVFTDHLNPEFKSVGEFQMDAFMHHSHHFDYSSEGYGPNVAEKGGDIGFKKNTDDDTQDAGGNETRPKNITVYYYMKIN